MRWSAVALVVGTLGSGCAGLGEIGTFDQRGFTHANYRYAVRAGPDGRVLPTGWELDNFQVVGGVPQKPKKAAGYLTELAFDHDGDGATDQRVKMYRYDLRFRNVRNRSEIWLQTIPLSQRQAHTELRVLMRDYVDAVSGAGFVEVTYGGGTVRAGVEQRFATRIVQGDPMTVHGLEAFGAIVEVANVDQIRLNPNARWQRARIVMVRTPFQYDPPVSRSDTPPRYPVLMLAGYTSLPEDFDADAAQFQRFLDSIVFLDAPASTPPGARVLAPPTPPPPELPPPPAAPAPVEPAPSGVEPAPFGEESWEPPPEDPPPADATPAGATPTEADTPL